MRVPTGLALALTLALAQTRRIPGYWTWIFTKAELDPWIHLSFTAAEKWFSVTESRPTGQVTISLLHSRHGLRTCALLRSLLKFDFALEVADSTLVPMLYSGLALLAFACYYLYALKGLDKHGHRIIM